MHCNEVLQACRVDPIYCDIFGPAERVPIYGQPINLRYIHKRVPALVKTFSEACKVEGDFSDSHMGLTHINNIKHIDDISVERTCPGDPRDVLWAIPCSYTTGAVIQFTTVPNQINTHQWWHHIQCLNRIVVLSDKLKLKSEFLTARLFCRLQI